jgi:hypothetical protein
LHDQHQAFGDRNAHAGPAVLGHPLVKNNFRDLSGEAGRHFLPASPHPLVLRVLPEEDFAGPLMNAFDAQPRRSRLAKSRQRSWCATTRRLLLALFCAGGETGFRSAFEPR